MSLLLLFAGAQAVVIPSATTVAERASFHEQSRSTMVEQARATHVEHSRTTFQEH